LKISPPKKETDEIKTKHWINYTGLDKEETKTALVYYEDKIREGKLIIKTQWENVRFK